MREGILADQIFENPSLVSIYDEFDGPRSDLDHYVSIVKEFGATSVLDVGCGTGCFALRLVECGISTVIGLDPAQASLDFARQKINADKVRWLLGDAASLPALAVDMAVMTGNVAQVFLTDQSWNQNLISIRRTLKPGGYLVFETRDPAKKAWLEWTMEKTRRRLRLPRLGTVEGWCEVTEVAADIVSFRWTYVFESGQTLTSDSSLKFRSRESVESSLAAAGYTVCEVRLAPDRPGKEFVFVAGLA